MDAANWSRIDEVLDVVLARDRSEWSRVLDEQCGNDAALRAEVEGLLARYDQARHFLVARPGAVAAALLADSAEREAPALDGRRIGAYRLVRQIGSGGMARVFLAERADGQFVQQAALKLLRPGLDTEIDQARFRTERQILARLNHPNIARLLDGGVTDDGQPYLVLELVDGQPIDRYCDEHALSLRERLQLFLTVLEATEYAHRNLIVHRDLKPSNILVTADGRVKLLDFGIAKLLDPLDAPEDAPATRTGALLMTPEYAAPEQVRGQPVSTATDVYALGVLLYALLTGRRPYDVHGLSPAECERVICETRPLRPSSMFDDGKPDSMERARARGTTPDRWARTLRGDLDAIVELALRKEPSLRYGSADQFGRDLQRYIEGRPVLAHRGSRRYRLTKFVRRNRVQTAAAAGIMLSLLGGAALSLTQARRASAERDRAEVAAEQSQAASNDAATVSSFLLGLFEARDPREVHGDSSVTAWDLLQRGVRRADQLERQPLARARMLEITAQAYVLLGRYQDALEILQRAIGLRREAHGEETVEMARAYVVLADVRRRLSHYAAADTAARQALAIQQRILGPADPEVASTLHQVANVAIFRGDLAAAEQLHRRALAIRDRIAVAGDTALATSHLYVGSTLRRMGKIGLAEQQYRRAMAIFRQAKPPNELGVAEAGLQIAYLLDRDSSRFVEAESLYVQALETRRRALGNDHQLVASALGDLGGHYVDAGNWAKAEPLLRERLEMTRRALGPEHPTLVTTMGLTADMLHQIKQLDAAEEMFREALRLDRRVRGPDHANIAGLEFGLARVLMDRGELESAERHMRDAVRLSERSYGVPHPSTAIVYGALGTLLTRRGRFEAADSVLHHAVAVMERQLGIGRAHPDLRKLYESLADLYDARGRSAEAATYRAIANGRN